MTRAHERAAPALIVLVLALLPLLGMEPRVYLTLTVAGLAMGMLIFLVASGLTLIFGLMDVLNFAHGALFSWGAYAGFSAVLLLNRRAGWAESPSVLAQRAGPPRRGGRRRARRPRARRGPRARDRAGPSTASTCSRS